MYVLLLFGLSRYACGSLRNKCERTPTVLYRGDVRICVSDIIINSDKASVYIKQQAQDITLAPVVFVLFFRLRYVQLLRCA